MSKSVKLIRRAAITGMKKKMPIASNAGARKKNAARPFGSAAKDEPPPLFEYNVDLAVETRKALLDAHPVHRNQFRIFPHLLRDLLPLRDLWRRYDVFQLLEEGRCVLVMS